MLFVVPKAVSKTDTVFTLEVGKEYQPVTFKVKDIWLQCQSQRDGFLFLNDLNKMAFEPNDPNP
jgi:hypothetical protein